MNQDQPKVRILADLTSYAKHRLDQTTWEMVAPFLAQYYDQLDGADLAEYQVSDLFGAVMSHFQLARARVPGKPLVRAYNPRLDEHAWHSGHTVVEIVNDDMPFLVDSVSMEINRQGAKVHVIVHPQMRVKRDAKGKLLAVLPPGVPEDGAQLESFIHVEMDRESDPARLAAIGDGLHSVLGDVRRAVSDWQAMREAVKRDTAAAHNAPYEAEEIAESRAFLEWLLNNHFTLLGYRDYDLIETDGRYFLRAVKGSGLGLLRERDEDADPPLVEAPPQVKNVIEDPHLLLLTKANARATVHRPGYLDYVGIKRFDADGKLLGESRLLGLYTSSVYWATALEIPLLRRKVQRVLERAGFLPNSHMAKTLRLVLESYPRDELFEISEDELLEISLGILRLQERQRTRLFVRRDLFGRFYSCFVFVPRDKYNTELRLKIQRLLVEAFKGTGAEFAPQLSESVLARIHFMIRTDPATQVDVDLRQLEAQVVEVTWRWQDELAEALTEHFGEERGNKFNTKYDDAFPAGYRDEYPAGAAVLDIEMIEALSPASPLGMSLYRPVEAPEGHLRFKLFHLGAPVALSDSLPMLERLGVRVLEEHPYRIDPVEAVPVWIHDIGLMVAGGAEVDIDAIKVLFQELFARAWHGEVENDDFNKLVILSRLDWRQIVILRAYAKYFRQIGLAYSQSYIEQTLAAYPALARRLVELFAVRFEPAFAGERGQAVQAAAAEIRSGLDAVANLDQDHILRQFLDTILATTRTNYYQKGADGASKSYVSFKFDPSRLPHLPEPRPMFEIFVYSPRVEGVHLRGGKVARGGLRWSDRREDFRTEVLGLVKAQMVKNTVIVPVGSKGGFFVKNPPPAPDRDALLKEGIECYKTFLRGLLDVTDNLAGGKIMPPAAVVRHDADDPYLVVAADKGTATFSDIANSISQEYGFWLGDAFASGGRHGYDHKKMGITARGAWESVKRHFRELGRDTQSQDFTVVGVGDMSGDVFGNGMLRSRHIRLVAAFDHRHVFIDPDPDAEKSFAERERLFDLPRSSWDDYDKTLISEGGGVWPLSAKSIPVSPQAKAALGIEADSLTPNELKSAILRAPVDLLYNGGIGTYVKAHWQSHEQVGDRANDGIRIDARELRCRVVAEGGNLGFTQPGRIEAAMHGVRLFTDAIDNSAGVDCSDHEVNIKILLDALVAAGDLTGKQRNTLLADMTDDVARLVLQDNYDQTQCLSVTARRGVELLDGQARMMRAQEASGRLKRKLEFLPDEDEIAERKTAGLGLTAPESAVLLAYGKMALFDSLVASDLPDHPFFLPTLVGYFPAPLQERFAQAMSAHPLKREIIATVITNATLNRMGGTFVHFVREETGATEADIVRAYTLVREVYELQGVWKAIDALDNQAPDTAQGRMLIDIRRFAQRATLWFLRHRQEEDLASTIARFKPGIATLRVRLPDLLGETERNAWRAAADSLIAERVPQDLADTVAGLELMLPGLDLVEVSTTAGRPIEAAAAVYYALDARLNHGWLRAQINMLSTDSHWQSLARASLRDDLAWRQRGLAAAVLKSAAEGEAVDEMLARWEQRNQPALARARRVMSDLQTLPQTDLSMLSVALRELRNMT